MSDTVSDLDFLRELIKQTDEDPSGDTTARDVLTTLGSPDQDAEPVVTRLKRRGLIDWRPGPYRNSDGWDSRPLVATPEGYRHDDTGLNR